MSFIRNILKEVKDENTTILADGKSSSEYAGSIDTGCYIFNAALSGSLFGGIPNNKITVLAGEEATGKTFFALSVVKNFLDSNPNAVVFYFDTEGAVSEMMKSRGIDSERVAISEPDTIQKFRTTALKMLDAYDKMEEKPPCMMVLDSLGMLSTTKEMEDSSEGKETRDMTKAQVIKATFRTITLKLAKHQIPLIVTNHIYSVVGAYIPTKELSGGSGLKYAASTIVFLSKKKDKNGTNDVVGNIIKAKMNKSRFSKENTSVDIRLSYKTGLDKWYGLLELAEKGGIFKKVSTRYELPDGTKLFEKKIYETPEKYFTPEIMQQLEVVAKELYSYGGNFEEFEDETKEDELGDDTRSKET